MAAPLTALREEDVGITHYVTDTPPFSAILKHRYTDFKVNEIGLDGRVVRLTRLTVADDPPPPAAAAAAAAAEPATAAAAVDAACAAYCAVVGAGADAAPLRAFLEAAAAVRAAGGDGPPPPAPPPLTLPPLADKGARTRLHMLFKALPKPLFPPLDTAAVAAAPGQPQHCVQARVLARGQKRARGDDRGAGGAANNGSGSGGGRPPPYVRFVLYKENLDTHAALGTLARLLGAPPGALTVAGTKDKRGVTCQAATAARTHPGRLAALNARLRGMRVGDFDATAAAPLFLGDLRGNRFELVLRDVGAAGAAAGAEAAAQLRRRGFVNYFGMQRFGSGEVPTHAVGRALLRGEWAAAAALVLTPHAGARPDVAAAYAAWNERGDAAAAARAMPRHCAGETAVLAVLERWQRRRGGRPYCPRHKGGAAEPKQQQQQHQAAAAADDDDDGDEPPWKEAVLSIPRGLRSMYVHAYQSYLWNAAASHRAAAYGAAGLDAAVAGDLVLPRGALQAARGERAAAAAAAALGGEAAGADADGAAEVHVVTADEAAARAYGGDEVVLPLPGRRARLPAHGTAAVYRSLAAADGISLGACDVEALEARAAAALGGAGAGDAGAAAAALATAAAAAAAPPAGHPKDFFLGAQAGAYRHVLYRPADLECEAVRYDDPGADLAARDDLAAVEGRARDPGAAGPVAGGRFHALRLAFSLPPSCYATMLVRELTKMDTSREGLVATRHGGGGGGGAAGGAAAEGEGEGEGEAGGAGGAGPATDEEAQAVG